PVLDVLLAAGAVLTLFTFARWTPSAWLVLTGVTVFLLGDVLYARLVAEGTYVSGGRLDTSWPIGYFLLAGAVLHPSMQQLRDAYDGSIARRLRTRMVLLGGALLAAPAVVLL